MNYNAFFLTNFYSGSFAIIWCIYNATYDVARLCIGLFALAPSFVSIGSIYLGRRVRKDACCVRGAHRYGVIHAPHFRMEKQCTTNILHALVHSPLRCCLSKLVCLVDRRICPCIALHDTHASKSNKAEQEAVPTLESMNHPLRIVNCLIFK